MISQAVERVRKALQKPLKKRSAFAVVASEPLATLIGCIIRGGAPEVPSPNGKEMQHVEILNTEPPVDTAEPLVAPRQLVEESGNPVSEGEHLA